MTDDRRHGDVTGAIVGEIELEIEVGVVFAFGDSLSQRASGEDTGDFFGDGRFFRHAKDFHSTSRRVVL